MPVKRVYTRVKTTTPRPKRKATATTRKSGRLRDPKRKAMGERRRKAVAAGDTKKAKNIALRLSGRSKGGSRKEAAKVSRRRSALALRTKAGKQRTYAGEVAERKRQGAVTKRKLARAKKAGHTKRVRRIKERRNEGKGDT